MTDIAHDFGGDGAVDPDPHPNPWVALGELGLRLRCWCPRSQFLTLGWVGCVAQSLATLHGLLVEQRIWQGSRNVGLLDKSTVWHFLPKLDCCSGGPVWQVGQVWLQFLYRGFLPQRDYEMSLTMKMLIVNRYITSDVLHVASSFISRSTKIEWHLFFGSLETACNVNWCSIRFWIVQRRVWFVFRVRDDLNANQYGRSYTISYIFIKALYSTNKQKTHLDVNASRKRHLSHRIKPVSNCYVGCGLILLSICSKSVKATVCGFVYHKAIGHAHPWARNEYSYTRCHIASFTQEKDCAHEIIERERNKLTLSRVVTPWLVQARRCLGEFLNAVYLQRWGCEICLDPL